MTAQHRSFEQYWAAYVLAHWQPSTRRFQVLRTGVGLARLALGALRDRPRREQLRWACAATLVTWGKLVAGTMDEEIFRVAAPESSRLPPRVEVRETAEAPPEPREPARAEPADFSGQWAVWQ